MEPSFVLIAFLALAGFLGLKFTKDQKWHMTIPRGIVVLASLPAIVLEAVLGYGERRKKCQEFLKLLI